MSSLGDLRNPIAGVNPVNQFYVNSLTGENVDTIGLTVSGGNIYMPEGEGVGYLLTSDISGNGTWEPPNPDPTLNSVTLTDINGSGLTATEHYAFITYTSGDILAGSSVQIVPAPGAGKLICPTSFYSVYNPGTAYSGTSSLVCRLGTVAASSAISVGLTGTTSVVIVNAPTVNQTIANTVNKNLNVITNGAAPTGGTGSVNIHVFYRIVTA